MAKFIIYGDFSIKQLLIYFCASITISNDHSRALATTTMMPHQNQLCLMSYITVHEAKATRVQLPMKNVS